MITIKDIAEKTMTPEKKASAKNDLFAFYVRRPLSYLLSIPFMYTNISPDRVSLLSIVPIFAGFMIACFAHTKGGMIWCWAMFFLWNLLDGVDGNVARYKQQFSKMGSVYDAMAGYLAAAFTFFSAGIMAAHSSGPMVRSGAMTAEALIIIGGVTAVFNMFPRLVMHKAVTTLMDKSSVSSISEKKDYGFIKVIALNLKSCAGGAQVLLLAAILLNVLDLYTVFYFVFNTVVMFATLRSIFKQND